MGTKIRDLEGYETRDQLIIRNQGAGKSPDERCTRDRIVLATHDGRETARTEGMLMFVDSDTAKKATKQMQTANASLVAGEPQWKFRFLQERVPEGGFRRLRSADDIDTVGSCWLYMVKKDVAGLHYNDKQLVGRVYGVAEQGRHAVIIRPNDEVTRGTNFGEILITTPLTVTQSEAVVRLAKVAGCS